MPIRRMVWALAGVLVALAVWFPGAANAREIRQGDQCAIPAEETIDGNVFILCRVLTIDGTVNGDILGMATSVILNGTVNGDIYLLAGTLTINGAVGEDVHFLGPVLQIQPEARFLDDRGDLIAAAVSTTVSDRVNIPGSVVAVGYQLLLHGTIGDEVRFWGESLQIGGAVNGNVDASVGDPQSVNVPQLSAFIIQTLLNVDLVTPGLTVGEQGAVNGALRYASARPADVRGTVTGETIYTPVVAQPDLTQIIPEEDVSVPGLGLYLSQALREFFILGVLGLLTLRFIPGILLSPARQSRIRPLANLAVGAGTILGAFLAVIVTVILTVALILILAVFQLVDLAVGAGILLGITHIGAASVFYITALFISRLVAALFIGRWLVRVTVGDDDSMRLAAIGLLVGITLLAALASIPGIGWVFNWSAALLGLGSLVLTVYHRIQNRREIAFAPPLRAELPPLPRHPEEARQFPPPMIDGTPRPPGMESLPPGFAWWDD